MSHISRKISIALFLCALTLGFLVNQGHSLAEADRWLYMPVVSFEYDPNRLTYDAAPDTQPAFAPDEGAIVFLREHEGQTDAYRSTLDGQPAIELTETAAADEDTPVYSPDGTKIFFASNRAGDWDIYQMDADGSNVQLTVGNPGTDELQPAPAPDGLRLVFSSNTAAANWDIYSAPLSGGTWTRLTIDPSSDRFPSFSADGAQVVFRSERDGNSEIYVMQADGSQPRRITNDPAHDGYPAFTRDGSGIVFASFRSGLSSVYQVNPAGMGLRGLAQYTDWEMATPRLGPSGRWLIYAGGPTGKTYAIYRQELTSPLQAVGEQGAAQLAQSCEWDAGVLAYGWIHAWQSTGESPYYQWTRQWIDRCIQIKTDITHVNDGLLGYAALIVYEHEGGAERLTFAEQVADYLINAAPRTADDTLVHDHNRIWVDTLLGSVPFLLEMARVSGDPQYATEAITQAIKHAQHLQDPATGLYQHAWDASGLDPAGQAYWARGNGWALLADTAILSTVAVTHPARSTILHLMQKQAAGLTALQDPSGLWHTVLTRPDFYMETSASALIGYALKRGIAEGWLDESAYETGASAATLGVWRQTLADGTVTHVSGPTWPMPEEDYNRIPRDALQLHGQGVVLLAESPLP
jgi:unsaturated rhamnogalacturonyl hydrolase